jgi:hypothetical protein
MKKNRDHAVSIYLEDWQMRLVKDVMGAEHTIWEIPIKEPTVYKYGVNEPVNPKAKRMYLTGWQKAQILDETGEVCNFIEIAPNIPHIFRYGVPAK